MKNTKKTVYLILSLAIPAIFAVLFTLINPLTQQLFSFGSAEKLPSGSYCYNVSLVSNDTGEEITAPATISVSAGEICVYDVYPSGAADGDSEIIHFDSSIPCKVGVPYTDKDTTGNKWTVTLTNEKAVHPQFDVNYDTSYLTPAYIIQLIAGIVVPFLFWAVTLIVARQKSRRKSEKKSRGRFAALTVALYTVLALTLFASGVLQKPIAVTAAYGYIAANYLDRGPITLQGVDYSEFYDGYAVHLKVENTGERKIMTFFPTWNPVLLVRNTFNPVEG